MNLQFESRRTSAQATWRARDAGKCVSCAPFQVIRGRAKQFLAHLIEQTSIPAGEVGVHPAANLIEWTSHRTRLPRRTG